MLTRTRRKVGAPIGNFNALKHGRRSPRIKAVRAAERRAMEAEERARYEAWLAPIQRRCDEQHRRIIAELEAERRLPALTKPELRDPSTG